MTERRPARVSPARCKQRGFTLLEVMITLVVFATLAAAVMSAGHYSLTQNAHLAQKLCGAWVADNHLNELQLGATPATARSQLARQCDQRDWRVSQTISPTVDPALLKVELSVSPSDSDRVIHRTTGWINALAQ